MTMFRFRGFKASLNLQSWKTNGIEQLDNSPGVSLNGAYRINRDELFDILDFFTGSELYSEMQGKTRDSRSQSKSTNNLSKQSAEHVNQTKSTNNLMQPSHAANTRNTKKNAPDIPTGDNRSSTIVHDKEQKKREKQRLADQKKQEKLTDKERKREEKLRKEREKMIVQQTKAAQRQRITSQQQNKEQQNKPKKRPAPPPQQTSHSTPAVSREIPVQTHATNTLQSSISNSSGPPPYSSVSDATPSQADASRNISFVKPVEDVDSWGLISQHRQQMNRTAGGVGKSDKKQRHLDLQYSAGLMSKEQQNSDA